MYKMTDRSCIQTQTSIPAQKWAFQKGSHPYKTLLLRPQINALGLFFLFVYFCEILLFTDLPGYLSKQGYIYLKNTHCTFNSSSFPLQNYHTNNLKPVTKRAPHLTSPHQTRQSIRLSSPSSHLTTLSLSFTLFINKWTQSPKLSPTRT